MENYGFPFPSNPRARKVFPLQRKCLSQISWHQCHAYQHACKAETCRFPNSIRLTFAKTLIFDHQACKIKFRWRELTSCLCATTVMAVCFEGCMVGLEATETGNEPSKPKFEFKSLLDLSVLHGWRMYGATVFKVACVGVCTGLLCTWQAPS